MKFKFFLYLLLCVATLNTSAQERVTTFGIQLKPIIPVEFFNAGKQEQRENGIEYLNQPKLGMSFGMVIRKGLTKNISIETGLNFLKRNFDLTINDPDSSFSGTSDFSIVNYEIPVFTVRDANLYGPGDTNISRIIPGSILRILNHESPILYSGVADYVREFLYVEDAAIAIIKLMENIELSKSSIFNIGSNSIFRMDEIMNIITEKFSSKIKVKIVEKDLLYKEIKEQYVDYSKLMRIFHEYSPRSMMDGLDPTIDWYKDNFDKLPRPN